MAPNSLPNDKILDWSKLKIFADDKIKVIEKWKFVLGMFGNIMGNGENAGYHDFFLFSTMFSKGFFSKTVGSRGLCGKEIKQYLIVKT